MHRIICPLLLFATACIIGCDKHRAVKNGFELIHAADMGPDSHPGTALGYHGKKVWRNVDLHTFVDVRDPALLVHDDIMVFLISIPDDDAVHYRYHISPQLCAIRGEGPPVVLSERIVGHTIVSNQDGVVAKFTTSDAGVHVEFGPGPEPKAKDVTSTHDITWAQIADWLATPQSVAPPIVKPLGTYRLLPPTTAPVKRVK
jgi:hypothetical protein